MQHARQGRGGYQNREITNAAPPPDLITGWRGLVPFLTARGRYATWPEISIAEGG